MPIRSHDGCDDRYPDEQVQDHALEQDHDHRGERDAFAWREIVAMLAQIAEHRARGFRLVGLACGLWVVAAVGERCGALFRRIAGEGGFRSEGPRPSHSRAMTGPRPDFRPRRSRVHGLAASLLVSQVNEVPM